MQVVALAYKTVSKLVVPPQVFTVAVPVTLGVQLKTCSGPPLPPHVPGEGEFPLPVVKPVREPPPVGNVTGLEQVPVDTRVVVVVEVVIVVVVITAVLVVVVVVVVRVVVVVAGHPFIATPKRVCMSNSDWFPQLSSAVITKYWVVLTVFGKFVYVKFVAGG
jgi:hypothetical protein